jgi:hypothetical protein
MIDEINKLPKKKLHSQLKKNAILCGTICNGELSLEYARPRHENNSITWCF